MIDGEVCGPPYLPERHCVGCSVVKLTNAKTNERWDGAASVAGLIDGNSR
jgi:hypothetical protein